MLRSLPPELLIRIAENLASSKDINSVILSCHHAFTSLNQFLYNHDSKYIVLQSAIRGKPDTLRRAIQYNLDMNVTEEWGNNTPLLLATRFRHLACVELLLTVQHLDFTTKDKEHDRTAIQWATKTNDAEMLQALLSCPRLPPTVASSALWTAVHDDRHKKPPDALKLLLRHDRIDVNTTFNGETALAIVTAQQDQITQHLLIGHERVDLDCRVWKRAGGVPRLNPVSLTILRDGHEDLASWLFTNHRHRIDLDAETSKGNNALHISAKRLRASHCEILLREVWRLGPVYRSSTQNRSDADP
ncbi:ankyrin [Aspergillus steynii IBT 23096]|uniref:Ankyrin n=1 Tax=Aspergillus steynii IBT 23096 TaxID=1392250 RepID=A0A2I2G171_9EURO|nr:ankyrin [Aspergillus steynii IBT 23096]PLB46625.1 ankyrin [Aspergillus steynii IBT 23096]